MAEHNSGNGKKPSNDAGYWIIAAVLLCTGAWPISLVMLIIKLMSDRKLDNVMNKVGRSSSQRVSARPQTRYTSQRSSVQQQTSTPTREEDAPRQYAADPAADRDTAAQGKASSNDRTAKKQMRDTLLRQPKKGAKLLMVVGAVIAAIGALVVFSGAAEIISWGYYNYILEEIFTGLGFLICGGVLHGAGRSMRKRERRYKDYLRVIGSRRIVLFKTLADASGVSVRRVVRDLEEMLEDGNLPQGAFLDRTRECLVLDPAAMPYAQETEAVLRTQQPASPVAAPEPVVPIAASEPAAEGEFAQILHRIRTANVDIEDAVMSAKIDHIENITRSIFSIVEEKPERRQEIRSFFNYYLPTTQKLLDFYAQLEEQPVQSQTIVDSRRNIEGIMDNLVRGFENQLDSLFRADALDISSDISVLENMLAQDGLNAMPGEDAIAAAARGQTARPAAAPAAPQRSAASAATATAPMPVEK